MRRAGSILALACVTVAVIGAVLFVGREPDTVAGGGETVFPALLDRVNTVARVRVTGSEGTFTVARDGETWIVEEKERHPADPDRVHRLILGAAGMRRIEPKTSRPELYPKLRLEDPEGEDAKSVRFVFEDASGAELANWVLGDRRPSKSDPARSELYVRTGDDPQAWLVEGSIPAGGAIVDWLDRLVARIDRERLRGVEVVHADGTVVAVSKPFPAAADFVLHDVPEGREVDAGYRVNDIGRFVEDLRFEDVMPVSELDFSGAVDKRVRVTTFDGLRIDVETVVRNGESFARLRAEVDEALAATAATAGAAEGEAGGEAGPEGAAPEGEAGAEAEGEAREADETAGSGTGLGSGAGPGSSDPGAEAEAGTPQSNASSEGAASEGEDPDGGTPEAEAGADGEDAAGALRPLDDVRAEAERLNARWADWAYELPSFKRDYIARRIGELTRPIEEEERAEGQAAGGN